MTNFFNRLEKVKKLLHAEECQALLVEDPANLYYLTGMSLSAGKILVKEKGDALLLVDNRYYEYCKTKSPLPVLPSERTSLESVLEGISIVAFDAETTTYNNYLQLKKLLNNRSLVALNNPIERVRSVKDPEEIAIMQEAATLGKQGCEYIQSMLKDGIQERELALELEIFWRRKGGEGLAFEPIIAFGENSALPHYRAGEKRLEPGMTVLMDIGVKWKHYCSDLTRTVFWGEPPAKMREIYAVVEEAQKRAIAACRPGIVIGDLDAVARNHIIEKGYGECFLHSLGHGLGLEVHEWPILRNKEPYKSLKLEEGMVITIEPGIYVAGLGGVRIEDTLVITSDGYRIL